MGEYPYDCEKCGGAYERCGTEHDEYEEHDCDSDCGSDCDGCDEREKCEGGQFCWEPGVVCVVTEVHIGDPTNADGLRGGEQLIAAMKNVKVGDVLYGEYNGGGYAENIDGHPDLEVCVSDDAQYSKNYVMAKVWCWSCYRNTH